jgi:cytoskeletal protein RodZ
MSADWFCKIGEKKIGPLNGQQLKTVVAKGQLKPEHFVRRGSEGPWVPAGRIKGLFPEGTASPQAPGKKLPQATAKPLGKAVAGPPKARPTNLPTAAEAPAPPVAEIPQEFSLGEHHKQHVPLNVEGLDYETAPVDVSRRKVKSGLKGLKKAEQKKLTMLLLCLIGGGTTIGLAVIIWAVATGKFNTSKPEPKNPMASVEPVDSGKKPKDTAEKNTEKNTEKKTNPAAIEEEKWKAANIEETLVGNVIVKVLRPIRGAPPKGAKAVEGEVLIVPVNLSLKEGTTKPVDLTSWADAALKKKVSLTDDQKDDPKRSYELLDQVAGAGGESKTVPLPPDRIQVQLIFQAPTDAKIKLLRLKLPPAAFHGEGAMICYEINTVDIKTTQPDKAAKSEDGTSGVPSKSGNK